MNGQISYPKGDPCALDSLRGYTRFTPLDPSRTIGVYESDEIF
jgi:hypothetical protein